MCENILYESTDCALHSKHIGLFKTIKSRKMHVYKSVSWALDEMLGRASNI